MALDDGNGIVQGKPHSDRKEGEKDRHIAKEVFESASVNLLVHHPIAHKKDDGAHDKEAHKIEIEPQMGILVFYI